MLQISEAHRPANRKIRDILACPAESTMILRNARLY